MKTEIDEFNEVFTVVFTAESAEESALLSRFGIMSTKKLRYCNAHAETKEIRLHISIGKRKNPSSLLRKSL